MCLDDGSRSSRSTVVEASYVQKTDSESLLYFTLRLSSNTVSSLQSHHQYYSYYCVFVYLLFQEGQSSQSHTASPLPHPHPPPPPTRPKKWAGGLWNVSIVITLKFKTPALSQLYLLCVCLPQCVWSRGWYVVSQWQRQRRVGRHGAKAGRKTQGADEGSDFAEDLCHAGPQSHDREAGEGGRRVRINREVLLPKKDKEQVKACKY